MSNKKQKLLQENSNVKDMHVKIRLPWKYRYLDQWHVVPNRLTGKVQGNSRYFHRLSKKFRFGYRKFPVANGTAFPGILGKETTLRVITKFASL